MTTTGIARATRKGCPNRPIDFKRQLAALACLPNVSIAKLALKHRSTVRATSTPGRASRSNARRSPTALAGAHPLCRRRAHRDRQQRRRAGVAHRDDRQSKPGSRVTADASSDPIAAQPHIVEFIEAEGQITLGQLSPVGYVAIASDDYNCQAMLQRRDGETLYDLLTRLDAAIGCALRDGEFTDEINASD